jgi:hypothetical protein
VVTPLSLEAHPVLIASLARARSARIAPLGRAYFVVARSQKRVCSFLLKHGPWRDP